MIPKPINPIVLIVDPVIIDFLSMVIKRLLLALFCHKTLR